jgi:tRNA nucleotidyltransferase (CCA-adding enzyme)
MYPNQPLIDELIRRIVETVHPLRIVLFGSAARGEMRLDSDIDVLIVMPEDVHRRRTAQDIHQQLYCRSRSHSHQQSRNNRRSQRTGRGSLACICRKSGCSW